MKRVYSLIVLLLLVGIQAIAQTTHTVTGKILDEKGQGFPGAGITVRGTQVGTVTDVNGDFTLEVPDGDNTLVIQALGYNSFNVKDDGEAVIVKLHPVSKQLEGTVVTAMAFRREKRSIGYNATTVNNEDLRSGNITSSISSLQGKVAGANITSSTGGPGGSTRIILRGEKSFLKDNNALIIVDGVITNNFDRTTGNELSQVDFGNSANDINPEDIESVTVLPGPAAAALYGPYAAGGAVMITTKKGKHADAKANKMEITYKATYTQSDILKYADMQHTYGQGDLYRGVPNDRRENFSWGYEFDGQLRPWGQVIDGKQLVKPYVDQPNNIKSFFNHGKALDNYVSLTGGNETSTYFLSLNALNSSGVVPNTFYNRYNVRFNGSTQLCNNVYTTVNFNYINTYSRVENSGQSAGSVLDNLYQVARDIPVWELKDYDNKFYSMQFLDTNGVERYGQYGAYFKNPYWAAKNYDNRNKSDRILGDMKIGFKKGEFDIFNRVGVDAVSDRSFYKTPVLNAQPVDPFYTGLPFLSAGGYAQGHNNGLRLYNDLIGNYHHEFNENFGIFALLGHNTTIQTDEVLTAAIDPGTNGLVLPNYYNLTNNVGPVTATNGLTRRRTHGVYGDVRLNYRNELFFEMTGRNDWSSTLALRNRSYFYPGVNAAWVFTERLNGTRFKENILDYGKVRMGLASVSKDGVPYINNVAGFLQSPINSGFGSVIPPVGGVPAISVQDRFGSASLRPETTREFEIGTDLSFLRGRINASFTYYASTTVDMISAINLPPSSGYLFEYRNIGTVTNRGVEVTLRGTPISTRYGLKWELFGTYTHNKNVVQSLNGTSDNVVLGGFNGLAIVAAVGQPFGTFYGANVDYWTDAKGVPHAIVDATTGLPIATKTPAFRGTFQPKFIASWGTEVSYKGLKLHALFVTKQGGVFYSRNKMGMLFNGTATETTVNGRNAYVWDNSVNQVPNTNIYVPNTTKFLPYDYYVNTVQQTLPAQGLVNASYVRLQELALSYTIPQCYYEKSPFGLLEAGIFGNNLILWTAKSNVYDDPETTSAGATGNGQGLSYTARPALRNYGVYLKVTF
ncbi:MAG: SusC/RagA family TonB-linked outer membrane protein [Bacteroidota bacterium]